MTFKNANKKHFVNIMVDQMMKIYSSMADGDYANLFSAGNVIENEEGPHEYKSEINVIEKF